MSEPVVDDLAVLEGLAASAPGVDHVTGEATDPNAAPEVAPAVQRSAEASAELIVYVTARGLAMWLPHVTIAEQDRIEFREKLIPVLAKHDGELPEWLKPWMDEIHLATFLVMTGYGIAVQHREHKKIIASARQQLNEGETNGAQSASAAPEPARAVFSPVGGRQIAGVETVAGDPVIA